MATEKLDKAFYESAAGMRHGARSLAKKAGVSEAEAKRYLAKQEIAQVYKKVPKQKAQPTINVPKTNQVHQADLLSLPTDGKDKYALVIVDAHTRQIDAEPLPNKTAATVLAAIKTVYARHKEGTALGDLPEKLAVDQGGEFKGVADKWFKSNHIFVVRGEPGHRSQAFVEAANKEIGGTLLKRMTAQELLTGVKSVEWVSELPDLVKEMNKHRKPVPSDKDAEPLSDGKDLLPDGTKVRVALEHPVNPLTGEQLHGAFRASDPRWSTKVDEIESNTITPGRPPMYKIKGRQHMYTRNRLQVIGESLPPKPAVVRGDPTKFTVEALLESRKKAGQGVEYLVKWYGYPDDQNTWEPRKNLIQDVPELVNAFEKNDE